MNVDAPSITGGFSRSCRAAEPIQFLRTLTNQQLLESENTALRFEVPTTGAYKLNDVKNRISIEPASSLL